MCVHAGGWIWHGMLSLLDPLRWWWWWWCMTMARCAVKREQTPAARSKDAFSEPLTLYNNRIQTSRGRVPPAHAALRREENSLVCRNGTDARTA